MEILDKDEILGRQELVYVERPQDIRIQGDWETNHFEDESGTFYPVIYHGQRFKRRSWRKLVDSER